MQTLKPINARKIKVAAARPVRLLGGTEAKGAEGQRDKGTQGRKARRGKGPHAIVFGAEDVVGEKWGAEPGLGRSANRRELATCADPRVVRLVPCATVFERAHEIRQYDKDARVEMLVPNFVGKGRNAQPFPGSRPRLYPERELTARGSQGAGGHSPDAVYDETEMRRRRMDSLMGDARYGPDLSAPGSVAHGWTSPTAEALTRMGPVRARAVCRGEEEGTDGK